MESEMLPKANTTFALALYKKLKEELKDINGNIFCSPFSISAALAMVMLGARGNTATQMSEVNPLQVHANMRFELYKPEALYVLSIANRLYGEKQYTFDKTFLAETKKHYKAELETVDFASNAEASREHINNWVEEQTQGKITDLLPSGVVSASTRLVLVNAIYFKGKWSSQFQEENTTDGEFRLNKTDTKPVKLMMQKAKFHFSFIEEVKCKVLEMPYEGNDLSMVIILPKDIEDETTGLEMLEQMLTYDKFKEWTGRDTMGFVEVKVRLPRFKMEESYDLKEVLKSMGMVDAFDVARSMSSANDLVLSEVRHKAFVEVNEEGTEAAAATGAVINERAAMITETFDGDHPFLFFIRHNPSNSVLFAGRFSSPE
uniref:Serpin domain-containing protein n=1 Tax=Periophthalmus magnuspinnatus TaxID=409849 RepID=A0A3B3ZR22_9GOBI